MEQKDYTKLLPVEPPVGMIDWLTEKNCFSNVYITYKGTSRKINDKKQVICVCSECGNRFFADRIDSPLCSHACSPAPFGFIHPDTNEEIIDSEKTTCPYCESEATVIYSSNFKNTKLLENIWPMSVERIWNRIALIGWRISRVLRKDGLTQIETYPYEAYVVEDKRIVRLTAYVKNYSRMTFTGYWYQTKKYIDTFGKHGRELIFPWNADLLTGTSLENSKLDVYLKCDKTLVPVTYCNLYLKHKNVENLIMQGAGKLVNEKLIKLTNCYYSNAVESIRRITGIDWKARKPHKMLGLNKDEFKEAAKRAWNFGDIDFYREMRTQGIKPENMADCKRYGYSHVEDFIKDCPSENIMKVIRYLDKQRVRYKRQADIQTLTDYWNMLAQYGEDLNDAENIYPQNLIRAHDTLVDRMKYEEDEELKADFAQRYSDLSKFSYHANGLMIRPAASQAELIAEGKKLHHCVGGYAKDHASGKTAIFFIRSESEPDIPYYTLELNERALIVRKNRGNRNCDRTEEVTAFEEKWLEHIRAEVKNGKEITKNGRINKRSAA